MNSNEITDRIKAYWNETSDSEWYRSLRTDETITRLKEKPESAFHPAVYELIRRDLPDLKGKHILLPSSGDNHAAFALAMMGAQVTSADISGGFADLDHRGFPLSMIICGQKAPEGTAHA